MANFFRIQVLALMTVIAFYTIYAYASSEQQIPGAEGVNTISGWNVSNVQYHLEEGKAKSSAVEFDLNGPVNAVKVSVNSSGSSFFNCVNTDKTHWYCIIGPEVSISEFDQLKVIAG